MNRVKAVLITDVHYNIHTLDVADICMREAITEANEHNVPLIVLGDLHDSKANLRAECVARIIQTFQLCKVRPIVLVGNHDLINAKSKAHALEFLRPYAQIVDSPVENVIPGWVAIPYYDDPEELKSYLKTLPDKVNLFLHQGVTGADAGGYILDKSAIDINEFKRFSLCISGHYHRCQYMGSPFWYLGNPYSLGFGEAEHGFKGFGVLEQDPIYHGAYTFNRVETNVRRHYKHEYNIINGPVISSMRGLAEYRDAKSDDLLLLRVTGPSDKLAEVSKDKLALLFSWPGHIKLELIPLDLEVKIETIQNKPANEVLDDLINNITSETEERKDRLKLLAKSLL